MRRKGREGGEGGNERGGGSEVGQMVTMAALNTIYTYTLPPNVNSAWPGYNQLHYVLYILYLCKSTFELL